MPLNLLTTRSRRPMGRRLRVTAVLSTLAWFWAGASAQGPAPGVPATADTVYHLHGVVLNAITGEPVARALVQSTDGRFGTLTDSEGRFAADLTAFAQPPAQPAV